MDSLDVEAELRSTIEEEIEPNADLDQIVGGLEALLTDYSMKKASESLKQRSGDSGE